MALGALVGTQLGQTLVPARHSPLVIATSLASAAALFAVVETPGVSQFFGCTPLGPVAWAIVGASAAPRPSPPPSPPRCSTGSASASTQSRQPPDREQISAPNSR